MKPYRGTLLAGALLLAALPLASCGDADDYAQTSEITLTAQSTTMIVKREMIFTVVATFPAPEASTTTAAVTPAGVSQAPVINQCNAALEYQATGAGVNHPWRAIGGNSATRTFMLEPREIGTLAVIARGKCIGSKEDWKYSDQVDVTVGPVDEEASPTVDSVTLAASPATVVRNNPVTFTLSATKPGDCTLNLRYQYSGAGFGVTTVVTGTGQFILTPPAVGTLSVTATGWCSENPTDETTTTVNVTVTDTVVTPPTITDPDAPVHGGAVDAGSPEVFTSGGATCSNGEAVQYEFSATNSPVEGSPTAWGSSNTVSFTWTVALPTVTVSVRARCQTSTTVVSPMVTSSSFAVVP